MKQSHLNIVSHAKKRAKKLSKISAQPYMQCLDSVAKELGFADFHDLQQKRSQPTKKKPSAASIDKHHAMMEKCIWHCIAEDTLTYKDESSLEVLGFDYLGRKVIQDNGEGRTYSRGELTEIYLKLLDSEIDSSADLHWIEWLTRRAIDKEAMKQYGYQLRNDESGDKKVIGIIFVSLGHYYRSLMDNCAHKIAEHINFKQYFSVWLRSMYSEDTKDEIANMLMEEYPIDVSQTLPRNVTSWAPRWWLEEQGRI
ncbi:hypothetical protein [Ferrimonas kyonanensis]|uniref:hypothetical protein n=1 Tax=Ferrimonas kyonanensis TaxID=364763 RepID=UPI00040B4B7C|nr:hypothetical protein [Ferrimonas kyonanensis]